MARISRLLSVAVLTGALALGVTTLNPGAAQDSGTTTDLAGVDDVSVAGVGQVTIAIGSPAQVTITGPQAAIDQIAVTVVDDEVEIEPAPNSSITLGENEQIRYDITVERLTDLRLRGAVTLETSGIQGDELDITMEGSTTAAIGEVSIGSLEADLRGATLLTVTGTADELEVEARESSTFDGSGLTVTSADVEARDAAHVVVQATGSLEAEARAAGIVEYVGEASRTEFEMREAGVIRPYIGPGAAGTPAAGTPAAGTAATTAHEISLAGRAFTPATIEIAVGEEVTWINDDDSDHTVSASDGTFDSGQLAEGATFSFTFVTAGEYPYFCAFHPEMQGTVVVR
jgi:plastocyanin